MKKNFKIAAILMIIAAICGLAVSGMNKVTSGIIEKNQLKKEEVLCKEIFSEFSIDNSEIVKEFENEAITKKIVAKNSSGSLLGNIYTVSGKNSYGPIVLLVGISSDGKLVSIEFLENGQSYSSEVQAHVDSKYSSGLTLSDVNSIDTKCGATYGANTVKELVQIAFNDYNGGAK
jgi:hypothetical protein